MFRDIRKKKNQISTEAAEQLLIQARRGVLAVNGREGYPYAIPINYYYDREAQKIYFHGARAGHKAEAIRACDKVCFTVYGSETIREEAWAPYLRSVVVFGRCRLLEQSPETMALLNMDESYAERDLNVGFSGGEKKKAEILQMLMLEPKLAILDETDSGLDVDAVRTVSEGVRLFRERTHGSLLIITHSTRILEALHGCGPRDGRRRHRPQRRR